jgi:hypothetical protein
MTGDRRMRSLDGFDCTFSASPCFMGGMIAREGMSLISTLQVRFEKCM